MRFIFGSFFFCITLEFVEPIIHICYRLPCWMCFRFEDLLKLLISCRWYGLYLLVSIILSLIFDNCFLFSSMVNPISFNSAIWLFCFIILHIKQYHFIYLFIFVISLCIIYGMICCKFKTIWYWSWLDFHIVVITVL